MPTYNRWCRGRRFVSVIFLGILGLVCLSKNRLGTNTLVVNNGHKIVTKESDRHASVAWQKFQPNRTLALVHLGKAGGLTLRAMTSLKCRLPRSQVTPASIQRCLEDSFGISSKSSDATSHPLILQTIYYAHMNSIPPQEMANATSWLLALRNPIDRVVSAFQYSHPANCKDTEILPNSTKGCNNHFILQQRSDLSRRKGRNQQRTEQQLSRLFVDCFPTASMEQFARAAVQQQPTTDGELSTNDCPRLAQSYMLGNGPVFPIPHLHYNYQHYKEKVVDPYDTPDKEWFGVRTKHLWEDFQELNENLGGGASIDSVSPPLPPIKLTHGSERYRSSSSSLTVETYQKLCCLLQDELSIYTDWIFRVWNLEDSDKISSMRDLAEKCGAAESAPAHVISNERLQLDDWHILWKRTVVAWKRDKCQT